MNMVDPPYRPEPPPPQYPMEASGIDVARLIKRVVRGLPIILLACVLCTVGAYFVLKKLPATYTSSVSILIDPKQPGSYGAETEFGSAFVDNSKISSVEVVLRSSNLLRQVVQTLHLADDPYYGGVRPSRLAGLIQWITGRRAVPQDDTPKDREDRAVGRLWLAVHPARVGATYVIDVDVKAPDPKGAARIASGIADAYIDGLLNSKLDAVKRDAAWLNDRLKAQREELIKSEGQVATIQHTFGLVGSDAKDEGAVDRQSVGGVNQQLIGVEGDVAGIQSRYEGAVALQQSGGDLQSLPDVANSPVIQDLQKKRADATQRLSILRSHYARDFPSVKQASQELAAIDGLIAVETRRIIQGLKSQYTAALAHKGALTSEMNGLVGKVTATANAEGREELREAQRIAEANRIAYEASLTRLRAVEEQESRVDVEARIIAAADIPDTPSFPRPIQILPAGAVIGLLLGLCIVFVLPSGKHMIETAAEVERDLSLTVLGTVPYVTAAKLQHNDTPMTIPEYLMAFPFTLFAESIRLLRYRLHTQKRVGGHVLQVTSSVPGEGKSTIAASLAISAATGHVRTVLIDLDLHRPGSTKLLGQSEKPGVADFLMGKSTSEGVVQLNDTLPMSIVGAGSVDMLRPGLVESQQLESLITRLRREYELVIIDTPPILAVADAVLISRCCDSTILVVAWRDTSSQLVEQAVSLLRNYGAPLAGVLLNKVSQSKRLTYGAENYGYHSQSSVRATSI
jgi:capsular exopolysaccharide synthesis family protein